MKLMIIQNICLRCGYTNETEIGLTAQKDTALYRCDNCKFIIFSSWLEEKED